MQRLSLACDDLDPHVPVGGHHVDNEAVGLAGGGEGAEEVGHPGDVLGGVQHGRVVAQVAAAHMALLDLDSSPAQLWEHKHIGGKHTALGSG